MTLDHAGAMKAINREANLRVKRERFVTNARRRMNRLVRDFALLRQCSKKASYAYGLSDVEAILDRLGKEIEETHRAFFPPEPRGFDFPAAP